MPRWSIVVLSVGLVLAAPVYFMSRIRDAEKFSKIAAGVQGLVIAFAVVVGGVWTLYVFSAQLQVENAEAQLEKLKRDLAQEPYVEIQIEVDALPSGKQANRYLLGRLRMRNHGTGLAVVETGSGSIKLARVTLRDGAPAAFEQIAETSLYWEPGEEIKGVSLSPGSEKAHAFALAVDKPGLYFISFSAPNKDISQAEQATKISGNEYANRVWSASRYVQVP